MDTLFSSLAHFPALRKCNVFLDNIQLNNQYVAALTSLFSNHVELSVVFGYHRDRSIFGPREFACRYVPFIRQVQAVHPDLQVGFGPDGDKSTLTLGKVTFEQGISQWPATCTKANCTDCGIFYPTLISSLILRAGMRKFVHVAGVHLANDRLDRCRVDTVVSHLNTGSDGSWEALHAEMNEAHDLATVTFETQVGGLHHFQMTVDCGHCLSSACFGCLYVG